MEGVRMAKTVSLRYLDRYMAADLNGNPVTMTRCGVGEHRFYRAAGEIDESRPGRTSLSEAIEIQEAVSVRRREYLTRLMPTLSPQNQAMVSAIFLENPPMSLHALARVEGKKPQAISERLRVLRRKYPELDAWWLTQHHDWKRVQPARRAA